MNCDPRFSVKLSLRAAAVMRQKSPQGDCESQRYEDSVDYQLMARFYAVIAEAAAIDLQTAESGVR